MSCSRWLSIQSNLALFTPVDSHCVFSELLWRRRRTRGNSFFCSRSRCLVRSYRGLHFLYLFHLALPFGEALLHSLFSFSSRLVRICHDALKISRNRPLMH